MKQVLYFSAKWCTACQATTPLIEQLKSSKAAQVSTIDVDYDVSLVQQYNIRSVPTTVVLENGNEVKRHVGSMSGETLKQLING
jgi:thioredoxin-like negative regulator of GroEL